MTSFDSANVAPIHLERHEHLPSEYALRVRTIESLLAEKGLVDLHAIDEWVQLFSEEIGPKRGAAVVAKAWADPDFKSQLLADAPQAIYELGYADKPDGHLKAVENTAKVHNLVVCTLCSCYPFSILGIAPGWYKSAAYRARAARDPRGVLREFGVVLDDHVEVRVWDSTAKRRYLVIPQRPAGTAGWSEDDLAALVTRDSMIGTDRDLGRAVTGPRGKAADERISRSPAGR
jgi:nitrile hydratase